MAARQPPTFARLVDEPYFAGTLHEHVYCIRRLRSEGDADLLLDVLVAGFCAHATPGSLLCFVLEASDASHFAIPDEMLDRVLYQIGQEGKEDEHRS